MKYRYNGTFTTITLKEKDICLHNGKIYELDNVDETVKKYVRRGYLTAVTEEKTTKKEKEVK
jgi:hypothetical protein